nr:DNA polymerase III subunit delta [Corallococcus coralloides]
MSADMDEVLAEVKGGKVWPLYLLWGEEFLVRKGADELVKTLVPDAAMGLNLAVLDAASPREVAQELATLPLFPGRKVVLVRDPEFLAPKKGKGDALAKARDAWKAGKRKEGARRLLALAGRAGWGVDQLDPRVPGAPSVEQWKEELNVDLAEADLAFLQEAAAFCRDERVSAPEGDASALLELLQKGVPPGHALVLAATDVDSRSPLLKFAQDKGRLFERKVAARHKDLDLSEISKEFLAPFKKKLGPGALEGLKERIGGNIRLLQSELEKLAVYAEGPTIEAQHVALLVHHAREEEFFELTEALQKRELRDALSYAEDAMGQGTHALQLLGAVASIVRSLLENHAWLEKYAGGQPPRTGRDVEARILPKLEAELKAAKRKTPNAWALAFGMQAAARYERRELLNALVACADADLALKSSASGKLVIERLLWTVCTRA